MNRFLVSTLAACVMAVTSLAFADIRPFPSPKPPSKTNPPEPTVVKCTAICNPDAEKVRLILPGKLKPGATPAGKTGWLDESRTVIAGLALSCSIGAVFVIWRRRAPARVQAVVLGLGIALSATSLLWANAPPPPRHLPLTTDLEITFDDAVEQASLFVPTKFAEELSKRGMIVR